MTTGKVRALGALATLALGLTLVASALAAHPKAGKKYSGFTSAHSINGFKAPVSFKVSSDGKTLLKFTYGNLGCFGSGGGGGTQNPYMFPSSVKKLGSITVSSSGKFAVKNRKSSTVSNGYTDAFTSSVTGKFKKANVASGTISYTERLTGHGANQKCSFHVTFMATAM